MIHVSTSLFSTLLELEAECNCVRAVLRGLQRLGDGKQSRIINPNLVGNYFTWRENQGMISFMPNGREQIITDAGTWERKGRQSVKPGKWIRAMLSPKMLRRFKDSDLASFAEKFAGKENNLKLTLGAESFEFGYDSQNYIEEISSCMFGSPVGKFYRCFPCELICAKNTAGKLAGRAIVWTLTDGTKFMDRVYAVSPDVQEMFFTYAKENNIMRKSAQSMSNMDGFILPDGSRSNKSISVKSIQSLRDVEFWPFLDTLCSLDGSSLFNHEDGPELLRSTSGSSETIDNHENEVETIDGEWIHLDDAIEVEGNYYSSDDERITICSRTEEYVLTSETYNVAISRHETITIHRDYVNEN